MASDIDDFSKEQMTKKAMLGLTPFYNNGHTSAKFTQDDEGEALPNARLCWLKNAKP